MVTLNRESRLTSCESISPFSFIPLSPLSIYVKELLKKEMEEDIIGDADK